MTTNKRNRIDLLGVIAIIVTAVSVVAGLLLAYYFQYSFLDIAKEVLTLLLTGGIETLILSMLISKILELNTKKEQKIKVTCMFKREFTSFRESLRQCKSELHPPRNRMHPSGLLMHPRETETLIVLLLRS